MFCWYAGNHLHPSNVEFKVLAYTLSIFESLQNPLRLFVVCLVTRTLSLASKNQVSTFYM